jgi:hypothetical protein
MLKLIYRKGWTRLATTKTAKTIRMENELIKQLKDHSKETMIPEIRIIEKALEMYLNKEGKK